MKNSSNEQYIYSFELLFISTTHVVPRAVVQMNNLVQMNNSSNGSSSNEIASIFGMDILLEVIIIKMVIGLMRNHP